MLALTVVAWMVRDVRALGGPGPLWEYWAGTASLRDFVRPTTTSTSLVLLLACAAAAVAALRSASAASVLIVTGLVTFVLRLPGVWTVADAPAPDELRDRALLTTYAALVAGLALIVVGAAGRRPVPQGEERPAGPGRGAGVAVFLLLGLQAVIFIAWEIRQSFVFPSGFYPEWFIGGAPMSTPLIEGPPGWITVTLILMSLVAAVGAVAGAALARPLGLIAGGFILASGVLGVARSIHFELYERFTDLDIEGQLTLLSQVCSLLIGPVVILLLARKGAERTSGSTVGPWGGPNSWGGGWGAPVPGQPGPQGYQQPQAPGFGPPPSSPPPRW
ncbi:hypothetical protein [Streptomyces sp. CS131]|uniref:hypothetical protein n=1 Tax=Streptomyces sp. CS131 TaxID=2162711 RepID=UPI000D50A866|nr:hypothetical protein [Streptomyces sp. CS131]PVC80905.1 hypothetical protein DBP20_23915 [Streptomyces sp. CS131]